MITLTPLSSSASSSSSSEPVSYLLKLDEARILLDLGQRDYRASSSQTSWEYEEKVRELAPTISLVLLSHSPTTYLSLYPYARARWGLKCPVYATQPTVEMGRVVCLAEVESWRAECPVHDLTTDQDQAQDRDQDQDQDQDADTSSVRVDKGKQPLRGPFVPTVEEVHEAFDWIKAIRYNQPLHLGGDLSHLLLTPFPSGHTLGGTLFKLRSPTSGTVLYAVGINHTSERHLDGMVGAQNGPTGYAEGVMRPDLLIVESGRSTMVNAKRRERETALLDLVSSTLESNHSLLLPSDPSPRLLELLILLDQHWSFKLNPNAKRQQRPGHSQVPAVDAWPYPLCLVSKTGQDMVAFARSLIEWMGGVVKDSGGGEVVNELEAKGKRGKRGRGAAAALGSEYGVLDFRHVQFFASPAELLQAYPLTRPKLVLAIPATMSHGPSRFLFTAMANTEGNIVLLTSREETNTLARELYEQWESSQDQGARWGGGRIGTLGSIAAPLQIEMDSKVPLSGAELEDYLETERLAKEKEAAHQAAVDRSRRMLEADDLETDSESESEDEAEAADGIVIRRTDANANAYAGDGEDVRTMSFDIFVKGQQMRVGRGAAGEMARFRMFPFVERKGRKVDTYGEGLDVGQWMRKGREIEEEGETEEVREAKQRKEEEEERQKQSPEPPSKYVSELITLDPRASVFFVDMEGLHDGQSIKTIISDLQPRKLILVRSSEGATSSLVNFLSSVSTATKDVYAPGLDETIKIGEHVQSYSITLGDSISAGLSKKWSKYDGYEVTMVDGKIAFAAGSTVPVLEASALVQPLPKESGSDSTADAGGDVKMEPEQPQPAQAEEDIKPDLSIFQPLKPSPSQRDIPPLPTSLFIGDLRLALLKNQLASLTPPIAAEFAGQGVLICGPGIAALTASTETPNSGSGEKGDAHAHGHDEGEGAKVKVKGGSVVAVRKTGEGRIVLEGAVGKVYWAVRRELYAGLAVVPQV